MFRHTLSVATLATSLVAATLASTAPASPAQEIRTETVRASLGALLASEGLALPKDARFEIRRVDLDGRPSTEEALVDVFSTEVCGTSTCPTLVVTARCGQLRTVGSGAALVVLPTHTNGWLDLVDNAPALAPILPTPKLMRWGGDRYGR